MAFFSIIGKTYVVYFTIMVGKRLSIFYYHVENLWYFLQLYGKFIDTQETRMYILR